jgi:thioredoxin 1
MFLKEEDRMSGALDVTQKNFDQEVTNSATPVLVDFWAEWCGPCKMMGPILDDVARDMAGQLKVVKVNIDDEQELAAKFNIMSIPTMVVFKGGKPVDMVVGAMSKDQLLNKIKPKI